MVPPIFPPDTPYPHMRDGRELWLPRVTFGGAA